MRKLEEERVKGKKKREIKRKRKMERNGVA